jgi:hypothetical protein
LETLFDTEGSTAPRNLPIPQTYLSSKAVCSMEEKSEFVMFLFSSDSQTFMAPKVKVDTQYPFINDATKLSEVIPNGKKRLAKTFGSKSTTEESEFKIMTLGQSHQRYEIIYKNYLKDVKRYFT